jgi:hypothetical protein
MLKITRYGKIYLEKFGSEVKITLICNRCYLLMQQI